MFSKYILYADDAITIYNNLKNNLITYMDIYMIFDHEKIFFERLNKKENALIQENEDLKNLINIRLEDTNTRLEDTNTRLEDTNTRLEDTNTRLYDEIRAADTKLEETRYNVNWIKLFGIYNNRERFKIVIFGVSIVLKINEKNINKIAWWIPIKKWRDNFRNKF